MRKVLVVFALALSACGTHDQAPSDGRRQIRVEVGSDGYHPAEVTAHANEPVRLVFTRTTDEGCGQQLVFPDLHIRRDLPLDEPVPVDVTMPASGAIRFTCGMNMFQGSVVAR
jgi:plastocyanin domain-containing protein